MSKKEIRKQRGKEKDGIILPQAESLENIPEGYTIFISQQKSK